MTTLHMETEQVEDTARRVRQTSAFVEEQVRQLHYALYQLQGNWHGSSRDYFAGELGHVLNTLSQMVDEGNHLGAKLSGEVAEWLRVDNDGAAVLGVTLTNGGMTSAGDLINPEGGAFNWWTGGGAFLGLGSLAVDATRNVPYSRFREWGRSINHLMGNQRFGGVGFMDDVGHVLRNPWTSRVFTAAGVAFEVGDDLTQGHSLTHTLLSEGIEFGAEYGIFLIPGVGGAYGVYRGALALGGVGAVALEAAGFNEEAIWLQNTVEQLDIVDNLTDAAGNWAADRLIDLASDLSDRSVPDPTAASLAISHYGAGYANVATY